MIPAKLNFGLLKALVAKADHGRPRIDCVVQVANGFEVMAFDRELACSAEIGDTTECINADGALIGLTRKTAKDGWCQWRFEPCLPS